MKKLPFWFMALAILYVIIGMAYGIHMSAIGDHVTAPAHGHLNLLGFVMGAIFAFYYHLVPASEGRLAWVHFAIHQVAVVLMFPGVILAIEGQGEELAKISSLLALIAALVFAVVHFRRGRATA
ncbi:hypothetical protein GH722_10940 [Alphaproteobacteria bacterium HT1-32]|nr:hypothetical protein [Alphaproteobacteria bacterium HT1-32]